MNRKPRKSVIGRYFALSIGFGILMGCIFPLYALLFVHFKSFSMGIFFTAGCIAAGIMVGLFSYLIGNITILRFLKKYNRELHQIAEGEGDLNRRITLDSRDLLGDLTDNFNQLLNKLSRFIRRLGEVSGNGSRIGGDLIQSNHEFTETLNRMMADFSLIRSNTSQLTGDIARISELDSQVTDITSQVESRVLNETRLIRESAGKSLQLSTRLNEVRNHLSEHFPVFKTMKSMLQESSEEYRRAVDGFKIMVQDIGKISAGIDSILQLSDQTRLLSFNASIESARAGSAGSGFKVVSAEIRKLSEHVDVTVKSISTMLKETLNRISSLMILFDESSSRLDQLFKNFETVLTSTGSLISSLEVEDFGDESKAGFSDQDERIQKLQSELASLIRLNTDINQVMKSIQIQSVSNLENVDKLSESMDRLFIDNESIENLIAHHAGQIEELNQEIRQFRLE